MNNTTFPKTLTRIPNSDLCPPFCDDTRVAGLTKYTLLEVVNDNLAIYQLSSCHITEHMPSEYILIKEADGWNGFFDTEIDCDDLYYIRRCIEEGWFA